MPLKTQLDEMPSLNMTSMIDIVFLLIIFFMVGTKFAQEERKIALEVPRVSDRGALTSAPDQRVVNVYRDGEIMLDGKSISLAELTAKLTGARKQYADLGVLVRGDGSGEFQRVADVLNACKQAGIAQLAISVKVDGRRR
ncbi:MAG TPA: biopolymer transporter ExbD [Pirellulales bacterium]|nr:biopolymer transporter ExbD [Pirellulales bacterium]